MKKLLTALLIALLLTGLCAFALADNSIVATTGISHVNVQYWQVARLILESSADLAPHEGGPPPGKKRPASQSAYTCSSRLLAATLVGSQGVSISKACTLPG